MFAYKITVYIYKKNIINNSTSKNSFLYNLKFYFLNSLNYISNNLDITLILIAILTNMIYEFLIFYFGVKSLTILLNIILYLKNDYKFLNQVNN